jgi:DNA-binding NtrC family response regulator
LTQLVEEDRFREDLYFRLYGVRFHLPALSDRPDDIELLAEEFLKRQNRDLRFAEGVIDELKHRTWPGNVRELEKAVERAALLTEGSLIHLGHFEFGTSSFKPSRSAPTADITSEQATKSIRDMEREMIVQALAVHHGNRTHTARALGMSLRTLRHKIKLYREKGLFIEDDRQKGLGKNDRLFSFDAPLGPPSDASNLGISFAQAKGGEV